MLKHLYKVIILVTVFIGSLYFFSGDIKEEDRQEKIETIKMGETTYPTISVILDDMEINRLHGYSNNIDHRMSRESITPIDEEQSFFIGIDENDYEIKRVDYELHPIDEDKIIEFDNIKALEKSEISDNKLAKIKFNTQLEQGHEYSVRITLVTSKSKKINYYTRIKLIDDSNYKLKLDYVNYFHNATLKKDDSILGYLEKINPSLDTLSYVTINSPFELVAWGNLLPNVLSSPVPTIKEISKEYASIELKYIISANVKSNTELFYVKEFYRVMYSTTGMYLLTYERTMESVFENNQNETQTSDIRLGLVNNTDIDLFNNSDATKLAFVFNRELWYFNQIDNSAVKVFSFNQNESDLIRDIYPEHDVNIINMNPDGNLDFLVYGYMNRGAYEGYVGIVLYRYYAINNRIEELTYIPINVPYQFLKETVGDFSYINELDVFYFHINDTIYGYNILTKQLEEIASDVTSDNFIYSRENHYIAWEEKDSTGLANKLVIYDLENANRREVKASNNATIELMGIIGDDFIYGMANTSDIITTIEGKMEIPIYKLIIADSKGNILKEYEKDGYYIRDIEVEGNIINVKRGIISSGQGTKYIIPVEDDNILNNMDLNTNDVSLAIRDLESTMPQLYITSPLFVANGKSYENSESINTVVRQDTTLRLENEIEYPRSYIVYALGNIEGIYENAGQAITKAEESVGVVFDTNQNIIWERGFTKSSNQIQEVKLESQLRTGDNFKDSAITLINYKFNNITNTANVSGYELLQEYFGSSYVNLTGTSLELALYFVSNNRPIIAKMNPNYYVLITGYSNSSVTIYDPVEDSQRNININQAKEEFEQYGNVYISYAEDN